MSDVKAGRRVRSYQEDRESQKVAVFTSLTSLGPDHLLTKGSRSNPWYQLKDLCLRDQEREQNDCLGLKRGGGWEGRGGGRGWEGC